MHSGKLRWSLFFFIAIVLIGILAATWNIILVEEHHKMQEIAKSFSAYRNQFVLDTNPWFKVILGSLGFLVVLSLMILFFIKTIREIQSNQIYRNFLDKVSHELKSPLTTLELTSSLLQKKTISLNPDILELWKAHDTELKRLRTEVDHMLESSRWQNLKAKVDFQKIHLENLIKEIWPELKTALGPNSKLERTGPELNFQIKTDSRLLKMIFLNIIENARKYSLEQPNVIVETAIFKKNPSHWSISIKDSGMGFDPKISKKLFDQFYRAENSAPHAISGSGLGLYLVAQASTALSLKIKAHSDGLGLGASFIIEGKEDV